MNVPITWGDLVREPAQKCAGGDFPATRHRDVYLPIEHFDKFLEVSESLRKELPASHIPVRLVNAPAHIRVYDPPNRLPGLVIIAST